MSFKTLCVKYFGCDNFYEILGLDSNASSKDSKYFFDFHWDLFIFFSILVKKAYHRLSLLVHPDRVEEEQKAVATEKFKALGKIHTILQDNDKRKLYDDVGEFDDEMDSSFNWCDYWRNMFRKIDIKEIEQYEKEYIGSETEIYDIKKAYINSKGNMDKILERVPFSNCDNEPRYIKIIEKLVEDGEVERYECFFNETKVKKMRRKKKWDKEKKEAEQINSRFNLFQKLFDVF